MLLNHLEELSGSNSYADIISNAAAYTLLSISFLKYLSLVKVIQILIFDLYISSTEL